MSKARTILRCPDCGHEQETEYRYDYQSNERLTCEECGFTVEKWCWDYVCDAKKDLPDPDKDYGESLLVNNGICDINIPYFQW